MKKIIEVKPQDLDYYLVSIDGKLRPASKSGVNDLIVGELKDILPHIPYTISIDISDEYGDVVWTKPTPIDNSIPPTPIKRYSKWYDLKRPEGISMKIEGSSVTFYLNGGIEKGGCFISNDFEVSQSHFDKVISNLLKPKSTTSTEIKQKPKLEMPQYWYDLKRPKGITLELKNGNYTLRREEGRNWYECIGTDEPITEFTFDFTIDTLNEAF